jgi:hypothetical protein
VHRRDPPAMDNFTKINVDDLQPMAVVAQSLDDAKVT